MFGFGMALGAALGGAAIWFGKNWIMTTFLGAEAVATKLQSQAASITAAIKKL